VFNSVMAGLDAATQDRMLENVLKASEGRTVIWATNRQDLAAQFDREVVIRHHRIGEQKRHPRVSRDEMPEREAANA
jgi:ABC-type transport system involved in cytochrome bd biosynthesis fused ATPase/permease subunit